MLINYVSGGSQVRPKITKNMGKLLNTINIYKSEATERNSEI